MRHSYPSFLTRVVGDESKVLKCNGAGPAWSCSLDGIANWAMADCTMDDYYVQAKTIEFWVLFQDIDGQGEYHRIGGQIFSFGDGEGYETGDNHFGLFWLSKEGAQ